MGTSAIPITDAIAEKETKISTSWTRIEDSSIYAAAITPALKKISRGSRAKEEKTISKLKKIEAMKRILNTNAAFFVKNLLNRKKSAANKITEMTMDIQSNSCCPKTASCSAPESFAVKKIASACETINGRRKKYTVCVGITFYDIRSRA